MIDTAADRLAEAAQLHELVELRGHPLQADASAQPARGQLEARQGIPGRAVRRLEGAHVADECTRLFLVQQHAQANGKLPNLGGFPGRSDEYGRDSPSSGAPTDTDAGRAENSSGADGPMSSASTGCLTVR